MKSGLAEKVFALPSFQRQHMSILKESIVNQFNVLYNLYDDDNDVDWNNMLSCASVLAYSENQNCLDAALRIAQHSLVNKGSTEVQRTTAGIILNCLTNKQAISLAIERNLLPKEYESQIPITLRLEGVKRDIENSFITSDDIIFSINKFQKAVYDATQESKVISISAPTSAGKSFILSRIVLDELMNPDTKINTVYLVPTRALVSQVEEEFQELLSKTNRRDVFISSVPKLVHDTSRYRSNLFVFTQERLHWFKSNHPYFKFDTLIVDEAQKIGDGYRGILLQQKIEDLVKESPGLKVYFSSPFTSNPEILFDVVKNNATRTPVKKDYVSVNQNLLFVSQKKGKPQEYNMSLCLNDTLFHLGDFKLPERPSPPSKVLPFVAYSLSSKLGGSLIYANGQADAEKFALQLYDLADDIILSEHLKQLIALVNKVVHPQYKLAVTLRRRIAFHYGNMPLLVKQEIERLFTIGEIHFLVCTSTLLEGVNLPARSIFILKPTRGQNEPMSENDFWNLAGRAGRLGKEFQGNIICIDAHKWENVPSTNRNKQIIYKAIDRIQTRELINYIESNSPRESNGSKQNLEYAFTYYLAKLLEGDLDQALDQDDPMSSELKNELIRAKNIIEVPESILLRNPGVSALAQQNLLEYFKRCSDKEVLIPVAPESDDAVYNSYEPIINAISTYLTGDSLKMSITFAILVVNWMRGMPLPIMINKSYEYWKRKDQTKSIDVVIRNTLDLIENYARFKFAKYSTCYLDILNYHLTNINRSELVDEMPDLNSWLEYGVSMKTQVSLIDLGLSRPTTLALSEFITKANLTREDCIEWVKNNDIEILGLPEAMVNEIKRVFSLQLNF
ncbi:DEAD/DEAH box helicase [Rufibacter sediminis]|uniref:DEAD/DEAH box helicase n=1 Tax=Rufibacter sediminis TaxID=2762756 RepID=A0ABR6VW36_9BACT|nr:DEAD/DEAH box helicase [Rufibacter sediminis]MBC3541399.1 DEAD/DEAH box helicase [Rufibacter sediminis]